MVRVRLSTFVFFFSSRRRHTRWTGDWSSDVCSSDLSADYTPYAVREGLYRRGWDEYLKLLNRFWQPYLDNKVTFDDRSEERRVGKEWRSRWWPYHSKKKRETRSRRSWSHT